MLGEGWLLPEPRGAPVEEEVEEGRGGRGGWSKRGNMLSGWWPVASTAHTIMQACHGVHQSVYLDVVHENTHHGSLHPARW
jgi:hypothetical protein